MKTKSALTTFVLMTGLTFAPAPSIAASDAKVRYDDVTQFSKTMACMDPGFVMFSCSTGDADASDRRQESSGLSPNASIFASGLDNPRGLRFAPNGHLYVTEAGRGGLRSTVGKCPQVPSPFGPVTGGLTGRISRISPAGHRKTVVKGLPSGQYPPILGSDVLGPTDIEFIGHAPYALIQSGCSKGNPEIPNAVIQINHDGTWTQIANLSTFYCNNPPAEIFSFDFDPEGLPYVMINVNDDLYVLEANHGELDKITLSGEVTRIVDLTPIPGVGHVVPTAMAVGPDGNFYVGTLSLFPYREGTAYLYKITPDGQVSLFASGLSTVLGIAFDCLDNMYVLESALGSSEPPFLSPGTGKVRRRLTDSGFEIVATGLTFPTAMTFGPDGALYVSNKGYGFGPSGGQGEIVKINVGLSCQRGR